MKVLIPRRFAVPIAISSVHGITDFNKSPIHLLPYLLLPLPVDKEPLSITFLLSSLHHFSIDIGYSKSIFMHLFWLCGFKYYTNLAWASFCIFYCFVHVPFAFSINTFKLVYLPISLLFLKLVKKEGLYIDNTMMKIVICHVLCNLC